MALEEIREIGYTALIYAGIALEIGIGWYAFKLVRQAYESEREERESTTTIRRGGTLEELLGKTDIKNYEFDPISREEIVGLEPILDRIDQHISVLNDFEHYRNKAKLPQGILLVGPPGVGKTTLARYIFSKINGEVLEFRTGDLGQLKDIRLVYKEARDRRDSTKSPVILFADEATKSLQHQTGNLLEELSGINSKRNAGIFFVGTSNQGLASLRENATYDPGIGYKESALYRPGRLEIIEIGPPNLQAKADLIALNLGRDGVLYNGNPLDVASMIPFHQTGAFTEAVVNEAISKKLDGQSTYGTNNVPVEITDMDLVMTINSILMGNKQTGMLTVEQKRKIAKHEIGHYLVARELGYGASFISVEQHSETFGYTHLTPHESDLISTVDDLTNRMKIFMGGYVMDTMSREGDISMGSISDLETIHTFYRYIHALKNRSIDPVFLLHNRRDVDRPNVQMPKEELDRYEQEVRSILDKYTEKINPLVDHVVSRRTVHTSELEKMIPAVSK